MRGLIILTLLISLLFINQIRDFVNMIDTKINYNCKENFCIHKKSENKTIYKDGEYMRVKIKNIK